MKKWLIILAVILMGTINVFSQEHPPKNITKLMRRGEDAYNSKDYTTAIDYFKNVKTYIDKETTSQNIDTYLPIYARSLEYLSSSYWELGIRDVAIQLEETIIELYQLAQAENTQNYAISLERLASYYHYLGNYYNAIQLLQYALEVKKNVIGGTPHDYATTLNNLAVCYDNIGDYNAAMELHRQALEIEKMAVGEDHPDYATSLSNLATAYQRLGNHTTAIELHLQALEIEIPTLGYYHTNCATSINNIGSSYFWIGDYLVAIEFFKLALEIRKITLGENHPDYAESLNNLAICYERLGNYATAIELNQQALMIKKNFLGENHPEYAESLRHVANDNNHLGDYNTAIELHKQALEVYKCVFGENHPYYAATLNDLAACYCDLSNYATATELYKQAMEIKKNILGENHYDYALTLSNLIFNYYKAKNFNHIAPLRDKEYKILKTYILSQFRQQTSEQRYVFWHNEISLDIVAPNNIYARVLSNDKQSMGLSYTSLLFSKGVILASDIEFDKVIRESGDTVLLEKFEELRTTRAILNTYYNKPIAERPEGEVERLEVRAEVLEKDLLAGSKEYADFTRRLEIEWQDVQAALGDKDVAIEILAADEHIDEDTPPYYAALVLRKGWDAPKFVELCGAKELQAYFDSENGLAMMYREANSKKLYDLIWGKLAEYINEGDNVYFSPGGLLHQVNVELLQDTDGRLANEKYNLHRVSSTRELCFEKPKIAHSEAVLYGGLRYDLDSTTMIAQSRAVRPEEEHYALRGLQLDSLRGKLNYLSASKTEVEKISKQMNQHGIKTTLYVEQIGNEESFKALSGKKTPIIHLATHGFFFKNEEAKVKPFFRMMSMDQERPRPDNSLRRSGLAFAGAQKAWDGEEIPKGIDDGVMLAQEIASMDLAGTDLVVLSACETGLGEINSEGVFGLQRAFKKAGVQTLVMSLWKVHDEATALFMQTFYENLLSGKSKRDSFAAAQMALREHRDYGKDPAYWAAFVMLD